MKRPIIQKLNRLIEKNAISMHVPGHKNMTIGYLNRLDLAMDMTEITGLDDMHYPEGIILESTENFRKHKNYDAFLLVNGTTSGILSVIQAFSTRKGKYLISRNVHKSVFHGLDITQQQATITKTDISKKTNQYVKPKIIQDKNQYYKLAICTYPNYYGETFEISQYIKQLHQRGVPILVDEAHGAHFGLDGFPESSMNFNADYVVQSYHKTLPALTMGSVLYIHKDAPLRQQVIDYLTYFQTSSPSYLIMSSLELANKFYKEYDSTLFDQRRKMLIDLLVNMGFTVIEPEDPLKLVVSFEGVEGYDVQKWFEDKEIYVELADMYQVLLVLPLWHEADKFPFKLLIEKIREINVPKKCTRDIKPFNFMTDFSEYKTVHFQNTKEVSIKMAEGKVLAQHIVPYPPGIPVMFKGEVVTSHMIDLLNKYDKQNIKVEGLNHKKILIKDE